MKRLFLFPLALALALCVSFAPNPAAASPHTVNAQTPEFQLPDYVQTEFDRALQDSSVSEQFLSRFYLNFRTQQWVMRAPLYVPLVSPGSATGYPEPTIWIEFTANGIYFLDGGNYDDAKPDDKVMLNRVAGQLMCGSGRHQQARCQNIRAAMRTTPRSKFYDNVALQLRANRGTANGKP